MGPRSSPGAHVGARTGTAPRRPGPATAAGRPPPGRGHTAASVLARVIDGAAWIGCRLPAGVAHGLAVVGGHLEWAARPAKRRRLAENLGHALGQPSASHRVRAAVRREVVNEARRSADLLWAIGRPEDFLRRVRIEGADGVAAAAARGRGVVLVGLHVGGWEVAAAVPARVVPVPTTVLVADDWLAWAIEHVRAAAGLRTLPAGRSSLAAARLLRRGDALLVLGDDASRAATHTAPVRFCDAAADLPAGAIALARIAGAPIVPFSVLPTGPRSWVVDLGTPLEPPTARRGGRDEQVVLQALADRWSALLRDHAEHWAASFPIAWREP